MNKEMSLRDKIIEFLMATATIFTILALLGIELKATIVLTVLVIGLGYITVLHVTNFFQKINNNIEEIKNYIKEEDIEKREEKERKMNKKGRIRWLVIIWSVIIALALFLLFKTLFNL